MNKRESPVGFISILLATFGLSIAGIWLAYQFGFNSSSDVEYTYVDNTENRYFSEESKKIESAIKNTPTPTPTPTPTSTPKKLKTANDIATNPVQGQVVFLSNSKIITDQGLNTLNQLGKKIAEFDHKSFGIRIYSNFGKSQFNEEIGRQRSEQAAGYLRHIGLKNKIVISKRIPNPLPKNLSSRRRRNQPIFVKLYKLR